MKIVHVAIRFPPAKGGGEQHVYNLAKQQVKMRHDVYVITTNLMKEVPRIVDKKLLKRETISGIKVIRLRCFSTFLPVWGYGSMFFGLKKTLDEIKPDIVHTHSYGYFHSDLLSILRKKSKWKLVLTAHGFHQGRGSFKTIKEIYTKLVGRNSLKRVDFKIALSENDKNIFRSLGVDDARVIPNGVDLEAFNNLPDKNIFRKKYGIKERIILNVGRFQKVKGHKYLIDAYSRIAEDFPNTKLVMVGEDWGELKHLKKKVEYLNLKEKVILLDDI